MQKPTRPFQNTQCRSVRAESMLEWGLPAPRYGSTVRDTFEHCPAW